MEKRAQIIEQMEKDKLKMQAGYEIMDQILSVVTENES
jgi:hypothetical protein